MMRRLEKRCWVLGMVTSLLFLSGGCQENSASLVIIQNQIPGAGCSVESTASTNYRPQGTLDVSWYTEVGQPAGYYMFPLVQNNLMSTEDTENGVVEQNCVTIKETQVDLKLGALGTYVESNFTKYKVPTAVTICPGEMRAVSVMVIPPQVVEIIAPQIREDGMEYVNVKIRMVGKRGGTTIKSNSMSYPIFICNGCLIKDLGDCNSPTIPESPAAGNECNPAQDNRLDCCQSGVEWICPAVSSYQEDPAE